ncbi:MAG: flavodoxin family protein [Elusimicrobiota bacterium]|jgi:multimeric flavodoxin WrbA|nr:flavodoxin family protein [Elusimicrobiota bacterium]
MKIIALNGSPRKNGNTKILIDTVLKPLTDAGAQTKIIQLGASGIKPCIACGGCIKQKNRKCVVEDVLNTFIEDIWAADALIIGSPTYFANATAEVRSFVDRVGYVGRANGGLLKRKVGVAIAVMRRAGAMTVLDSINKLFFISDMYSVGSSYWNIAFGREKREVVDDEEGMKTMINLGENILYLLRQLKK